MSSISLSKEELCQITERKYKSAQIKQLAAMGIYYKERGDNFPLVSREHYDQVMNPLKSAKAPKVTLNL